MHPAEPCGHEFHDACLQHWINLGHQECPMCRTPLEGIQPDEGAVAIADAAPGSVWIEDGTVVLYLNCYTLTLFQDARFAGRIWETSGMFFKSTHVAICITHCVYRNGSILHYVNGEHAPSAGDLLIICSGAPHTQKMKRLKQDSSSMGDFHPDGLLMALCG
jgi:Ring finger domain